MKFGEGNGILSSRWIADEIADYRDFVFLSEASYQNFCSIMAAIVGVNDDSTDQVIMGLNLEWSSAMTCYLRAGMAISFTGKYFISGAWTWTPSAGESFTVVVPSDTAVVIGSGSSSDRYDLIEIRPAQVAYDPRSRNFRDPVTLAITTGIEDIRYKYVCDTVRIVPGTPGAGYAPAVDAGWIKVAEVYVPALASAIDQSKIKDVRDNAMWTLDAGNTIIRNSTMYTDNIAERTTGNGIMVNDTNLYDLKGGWLSRSETFTWASADVNTFTMTCPGDLTAIISVGMRMKLQQSQALTSYWSFNSDLTDAIAAHNGTAIGGAASGAGGKFNNGLVLNGTTQAISIVDHADLKPTGDFTIGAWIKTNSKTTVQYIFQSGSQNSNYAGISLAINSVTGALRGRIGTNTGGTKGVDYSEIVGHIDLTDDTYHYIVFTFKADVGVGGKMQVYVDGNLDASDYSICSPVYATTNYIRIGCSCLAGSNGFWFGSGSAGYIDDVYFIKGYALDEQTIRTKYIANIAQGIAAITVTKNFIVTLPPTYSGGVTTVTLYGGTDFYLTNSTISNVYYSGQKIPYGFNINPDKWTVLITDIINHDQGAATVDIWYNTGSNIISVPIGLWHGSYKVSAWQTNSGVIPGVGTTLSEANNSESNPFLTSIWYFSGIGLGVASLSAKSIIKVYTRTPYYLNIKAISTGATHLEMLNTYAPMRTEIICAYL